MADIAALMHEAEQTAAHLPPLTLKVERVANTPVLGTHGRRRAGTGEAFWQYDEYRPGQHEIKNIAWRESAKSDSKTFVRQNEWEASQAAYIWCDNSPEMAFTSDSKKFRPKSEVAQVLALALARGLTDADERVALLGSPSGLSNRIDSIAADLQHREESDSEAWQKMGFSGRPPLANSTVIIISDFMEDPAVINDAIARLASRNVRGHLLQVLDPAEVNRPYSGHVEFQDYRGGSLRLPKSEELRTAYYEKLQAQQAALLDIANSVGWGFSCHLTSRAPHEALLPLYAPEETALPKFEDGAALQASGGGRKSLWQRLRRPQP